MAKVTSASEHIKTYSQKLARALELPAMDGVPVLAQALREAWQCGRSVYLCGNGGSAANAIHLANDLLYGAGISNGAGLKVEALTANPAVITSLANDVGFADIFAEQLRVKAHAGDVLIALSGSGNSPNVVKALETGNAKGMRMRGPPARGRAHLHAVALGQPDQRPCPADHCVVMAVTTSAFMFPRHRPAHASFRHRRRGLHRQPAGR